MFWVLWEWVTYSRHLSYTHAVCEADNHGALLVETMWVEPTLMWNCVSTMLFDTTSHRRDYTSGCFDLISNPHCECCFESTYFILPLYTQCRVQTMTLHMYIKQVNWERPKSTFCQSTPNFQKLYKNHAHILQCNCCDLSMRNYSNNITWK